MRTAGSLKLPLSDTLAGINGSGRSLLRLLKGSAERRVDAEPNTVFALFAKFFAIINFYFREKI